MTRKINKSQNIPQFSSEQEAFEWYEIHEVTDHLDDTEEIDSNTVFYQTSNELWYRAFDGVKVSPPRNVVIFSDQEVQDKEVLITTEAEGKETWTSSSHLYATTLSQ